LFRQVRVTPDSDCGTSGVKVLQTPAEACGKSAPEAARASSSAVEVFPASNIAVAVPAVVAALLSVLESCMAAASVVVVPIDTHREMV